MSAAVDRDSPRTSSDGSRLLRKARSFKDDIKSRIRRTPSLNRGSSNDSASGSPGKHPTAWSGADGKTPKRAQSTNDKSPTKPSTTRNSKKRGLGRTGSFHEGSKTDKSQDLDDIEKLEMGGRKVFQSLSYIRDVIDKHILQMLAGAVTVLLETVMEMQQLLGNYFVNQDSSLLTSTSNQVYQSLADMVRWSDHVLLNFDKPLNKDEGYGVLDGVQSGIEDLMKLSKDKLRSKSHSAVGTTNFQSLPPRSPLTRQPSTDSTQRSSLPDIPLTPREKTILQETSNLTACSNAGISKSSDGALDTRKLTPAEAAEPPPDKPPLPPRRESYTITGRPRTTNTVLDTGTQTTSSNQLPPPLPIKQRSSSLGVYDNAAQLFQLSIESQPTRQSPEDGTGQSGIDVSWGQTSTTSQSSPAKQGGADESAEIFDRRIVVPQHPSLDSLDGGLQSCDETFSQSNVMVQSHAQSASSSSQSNWVTQKQPSPVAASVTQGSVSPALPKSHSQSPCSVSPALPTPHSQSPSSSVSSIFSASSEDLLDDRPARSPTKPPSAATTPAYQQRLEVRLSQYDNFDLSLSLPPGSTDIQLDEEVKPPTTSSICDSAERQILALTNKINQMTSKISSHEENVYDNMPAVDKASSGDSAGTVAVTTAGKPPPLPDKNGAAVSPAARSNRDRVIMRPRTHSEYDNITSTPSSPKSGGGGGGAGEQTWTGSPTGSPAAVVAGSASGFPIVGMRQSHSTHGFTSPKGNYRASTTSTMFSRSMQVTVKRETIASSETFSSWMAGGSEGIKPPPLPPKKKHVEAYMQLFRQEAAPAQQDVTRHSLHAVNVNHYQAQWHQHQMELFHATPCYPRSNTISVLSDISNRSSEVFSIVSGSSSEDSQMAPPSPPRLPPKQRMSTGSTSSSSGVSSRRSDPTMSCSDTSSEAKERDDPAQEPSEDSAEKHLVPVVEPLANHSASQEGQKDTDSDFSELGTLEDVDVSDLLVRKKPEDDGPDLRGGTLDALLVHATTAGKHDFMYQEAFLTTYRTFLSSKLLIEKLLHRYNHFSHMSDVKKKKLSRNAFSLLIRVVDELCTEIDEELLQLLMSLVFQLLRDGELMLARILRKKLLEKCEYYQERLGSNHSSATWPQYHLTTRQYSLTDFKSEQIAEQMTMLDAELFEKIEIPEVLLWSKEQNEEHSPNLTRFTEHFNKMSYWCRTRILVQEDSRERERCLMKFIKIMKHLRRLNNFNSYLAVLSALDSAPVRRLEWHKQNVEALREFCLLIDSSASFRAYRQALSETEPPCIPYIGLILQDLTFIHIGNPDKFADEMINFAKRWQMFSVLDNMRRFRKCNYEVKKHHKIMAFFNYFEDALPEETLWQISENYKPRGGGAKKKQDQ